MLIPPWKLSKSLTGVFCDVLDGVFSYAQTDLGEEND